MAADTPHSGSRNVSLARLRVKLSSLNDLDRRTGAYKRVAALIAEIESDLGGSENLSTATRQIIQRAAVAGALAEDLESKWLAGIPTDPAVHALLANSQRRLLLAVGLNRVPRDVTQNLADYLKQQHDVEAVEANGASFDTDDWSDPSKHPTPEQPATAKGRSVAACGPVRAFQTAPERGGVAPARPSQEEASS